MHRSRVDAFRHRAICIIAHRRTASHALPRLTLTPVKGANAGKKVLEGVPCNECHPPRVVPDIDVGARGAESADRELGCDLGFAIALLGIENGAREPKEPNATEAASTR